MRHKALKLFVIAAAWLAVSAAPPFARADAPDPIVGVWESNGNQMTGNAVGPESFEGIVTATTQCPALVPYIDWPTITGKDGLYAASVRWFQQDASGICPYAETDPTASIRLAGPDTLIECSTPP